MSNFWNDLPKPFFALAPMEAVTDIVFRRVVAKAAQPDLYFTEFTNAASFCSPKGSASTKSRLAFCADEQPIVAQIWGNDPANFTQMSQALAAQNFAGIDINMGCPDKAVVKQGSGSALIKTPDLARQLILAAQQSGLPVSVKTRLGYSHTEEYQTWLSFLLEQNLANLTVHLRTKKEMSKVPAHYELIDSIKKLRDQIAPQTLLTINGDITDRAHGEILANKHNIDGIMIGRGIFTNPLAFSKTAANPNQKELLNLLKYHLDLHDHYHQTLAPRRFEPLKRFFKIYIRDFAGANQLRANLMTSQNTTEARQIIEQHFG